MPDLVPFRCHTVRNKVEVTPLHATVHMFETAWIVARPYFIKVN